MPDADEDEEEVEGEPAPAPFGEDAEAEYVGEDGGEAVRRYASERGPEAVPVRAPGGSGERPPEGGGYFENGIKTKESRTNRGGKNASVQKS